jgi:hypothetical protein
MGVVDGILDLIGTVFGVLALIDIVLIIVLFFSYWGGIITGNVAVLGIVIVALMNFLIGAIMSEILQEIIEGIVKIFGAIFEAIASFIEAILGLFGR